jgi:polygalacturonase
MKYYENHFRIYQLVIISLLVCNFTIAGTKPYYNVIEYGAKKDGQTLNTKAIQKAIDECSNDGGGTVEFPPGTYLSGTIFMKSNVVLNLQPGCTILGSKNLEDYPLSLHQQEKNIDKILLYRALIWGDRIENVGITGFGTIDGQGKNFHGIKIRPRLLMFDSCANVNIKGITLQHPGAWTQHYLKCDGVTIRDIKVFAHGGENNDMVDIDQSRNVIITGLVGDSDDDGITLKSTAEGLVENVTISDCIIRTRTNAIKAGTESYGGFRDITITNCTISPSVTKDGYSGFKEGMAGIALEIVDGGIMENVVISNMVIEETTSPIFIRLGNRARNYPKLGLKSKPVGSVKNINVSNILASNASKTGCSIVGEIGHPIENVSISNVKINFVGGGTLAEALANKPELINEYPECIRLGILPAYGFFVRHVDGIIFSDVELTYNNEEHRPAMLFNDVDNLKLFNFTAEIADDALGQLVLQNTRNVFVNGCSPNNSNIFLRIEQNSENINVVGNNLSNVKKPISIDETINTNELNIAPNLTGLSTLFEFLQPNIERDSLGMVNIYYPNNAYIYYTTDGSQPRKSSKKYSKAFEQISSSTISAIAFEEDKTSSTAFLELNRLQVLSPHIFPADQYFNKEIEVKMTSRTKGAKIYYTTDGSNPDKTSSIFTKPINIQNTSILRAIAIKDGYETSRESFAKYKSLEKLGGVQYKYYESRWAKLPDFINLTPLRIGVVDKFSLADLKNRGSDFGLVMHGFLDIKNSGYFNFFASTNDGSRLLVDNREIINNDGAHPTIEKSGKVYLEKGNHLIEVRYFQAGGGKDLKIYWEGPEIEKQEIPADVLFR